MIAQFFIERPVLANVIAWLMLLLGAVALLGLPVAQYPPLTPPTIQVTANYPGANARTVQEVVARTIEQQVNGVEGMIYMQSYASNDGRYSLTVSFAVGTNSEQAQVAVQNRVAAALPTLPQPVQQQGVVTKKRSTAILQIATVSSTQPQHDALFLSNFASLQLRDRLVRLPGVADVNVFGVGSYSMRVWLDPAQLRQRRLNPSQVVAVISKQNQRVSAGQLGAPPVSPGSTAPDQQLTLTVDSPLSTPEDFGQLVVATASDGSVTRLADIARIELGSQNYGQGFTFDGKPAGGLAIFQLPDANALDTARAVREAMAEAAKAFPEGVGYDIPFDTTLFVTAAVNEVYKTLIEAGVLVLLVILAFLQSWRATLVPGTTVPITVVGAFAAMAVMGFSVNLLTLFAIVLCIGIVVDDAIVVVEGVAQKMEQGLPPRPAAVAAMKELLGPIIGITLVLCAVFLPAAFLPGITGQMYRQFALVIAATAVLSGINAITLKPTQSAQFLRVANPDKKPGFLVGAYIRGFNRAYGALEAAYMRLIGGLIRFKWPSAAVAVGLMAVALVGFIRIPTGFIPTEDQGYVLISVQLPDAAALGRTQAVLDDISQRVRRVPGVKHAIAVAGVSATEGNTPLPSAGLLYVTLHDWKERTGEGQDLRSLYVKLSALLAEVPQAQSRVLLPAPISGLGLSGGFQMQLVLKDGSNDWSKLAEASQAMAERARGDPRFQEAFTPLRVNVPQLRMELNRSRAEALGVSVSDAYDTVQTYLGASFVNLFSALGQNYTVYVQADPAARRDLAAIGELTVRSKGGEMVPLGAFAQFTATSGPAVASQYNLYPTATLLGAAAPGVASGETMAALEEFAAELLPPGVGYEWTAMSYQEKLVGNTVVLVFGLALVLVYLVLAGQYESWRTPLPVLLSVPLALVGTVGALLAVGLPNNIYVQIGLVLLIALSAKNAILIVEVASELIHHGHGVAEAALEASRRRLRPILMTSLTFILGVVPLVLSSGAGAAARISIGITVLSGMVASTVLAVAFVPVFTALLLRPKAQS
ncbi:MAG: efflux RND transporter permease subunit [Betaproteobacteria bacterium]|nr:efflux RND transporter permease subunit [Betaproteobacteria bacterium]